MKVVLILNSEVFNKNFTNQILDLLDRDNKDIYEKWIIVKPTRGKVNEILWNIL